jgi:hypothetical protein
MSSHPNQESRRLIRFGLAKGKFAFPDDFDADNALIERQFSGLEVDHAKRGVASYEAKTDEKSCAIEPPNKPQ